MIIDTHVHLNDERYAQHLDEIIKEARENQVEQMIVVGYDFNSSIKAIEIANEYDNIYCAIGIHPSEVQKADYDISWIKEYARNHKVVAIGEIGLDYYWDKTYKEEQISFFKKQLELAKELNLPVIIHSREAMQETYDILKVSNVYGVMHCYSSSIEMAKAFTKIGFLLGIGGVLTFKNSKLKDVVKEIDLQYLLSETDAPYLTPEPYRGKLNYPKYTRLVVEEIARIKKMHFDDVCMILFNNAQNIFKLKEVKNEKS